MQYVGEIISLVVAVSWTVTALFAEVGSKRLGSLQMNVIRMVLSLLMLGATLWWFTGSPVPLYADGKAWFWLSMSGFVGEETEARIQYLNGARAVSARGHLCRRSTLCPQ